MKEIPMSSSGCCVRCIFVSYVQVVCCSGVKVA